MERTWRKGAEPAFLDSAPTSVNGKGTEQLKECCGGTAVATALAAAFLPGAAAQTAGIDDGG